MGTVGADWEGQQMNIFQKLPLYSLVRRPARSGAMLAISVIVAFAVFSALLMSAALGRGMTSLQQRLGADIMVVPAEAEKKAAVESIVLQGNPTYFYMDEAKLGEVNAVEGVGETTVQLYLASLAASCCSAKVQLMGFDPATDFVIKPWVSSSYGKELGEMEVVAGSGITASAGDRLIFYDTPCTVVAKLSETGTNYDRCVFAGEDTVRVLTQSAIGKNLNQFRDTDPDHVISCILLNVEEGADIDQVASKINESVDGVAAIRTRNLLSGTARSLEGVLGMIRAAAVVVLVLGAVILAIAYAMQIHERKREFATLRILGVSRKQLSAGILKEIAVVCLAGGAAGALLGMLVMIPFSGALQGWLNMPMLMPGIVHCFLYLAGAVFLCLAGAMPACLWSVWKVSRAEISDSLREEK
jgi:putative ABC transport system permease protein